MTLTPVGDAAAKDFVVRFYEHWLGQGGGRSDPAAALRATKLEYIRSADAASGTRRCGRRG
jgi:hypothetical protein